MGDINIIENEGDLRMNRIYKKADISDIDILTKMRVQVLRVANRLSYDEDMSLIENESYNYYKECLVNGSHIAYLVIDDNKFIGAGGVSFYKVMPTYNNPKGVKAYIMNMYTHPDYRRKGIAYKTLDMLVNEAKNKGIDFITLEATEMGRPLYKKYGFKQMQDEMELL